MSTQKVSAIYPLEIDERFRFVDYAKKRYKIDIVAVVNEGKRAGGSAGGNKLTAWRQARKLGIVSGYPDCLLDLPAYRPGNLFKSPYLDQFLSIYLGLRIEMKRMRRAYGKTESSWIREISNNQRSHLWQLRERGYAAVVAYGADEAQEILDAYLAGRLILPVEFFYPIGTDGHMIFPS